MPTLNMYVCHLKTYQSYPSILLHPPLHAINLPHPPTNTVLGYNYLLLYSSMHM